MAVKIGHASLDERRKAYGGKAGDQTGTEVTIRTWYNRPWTVILRAKDAFMRQKMAEYCEAGCGNPHIGYDQYQRNTLFKEAKKVNFKLDKIITDCETDCSAFVSCCAYAAGVKLDMSGNAPTTSTMRDVYKKTGQFSISTNPKYLTSDKYVKRGDILVYPGHHTAMVLQNGAKVSCPYKAPTKSVKPNSSVNDVKWLQWKLNDKSGAGLTVDGKYGAKTQKAVLNLWKKLNWNKDGADDGLTAGKKTRRWLSK